MPLPSSLLYAGGGALTGAALGGLTSKPEDRVQNALRGGAVGGLVGGGAAALAGRNVSKLTASNSDLSGKLQQAETRIGRLLGRPTNPVARVPITPVPPDMRRANEVVDSALNKATQAAPRNAMTPPPPAPVTAPRNAVTPPALVRQWPPTRMDMKTAMSPLQGALAGAVTGGVLSGGASAVAGERDPKKLLRNAGAGAAIGGCAGYGIAHSAGACEHAKGVAEGYARRKAVEPSLDVNELIRQAMGPLDALRGRT